MKKEIGKEYFRGSKNPEILFKKLQHAENADHILPVDTDQQLFDEDHVMHLLKHYLPSQTPLKDFIHHNSLHAFQHMKFYDAIFKASGIFGYQVTLQLTEYRQLFKIGRIRNDILESIITKRKGVAQLEDWKNKLLVNNYDESGHARIGALRAEWKSVCNFDLDNMVQPLLFRILCSYLDQGIALWKFPVRNEGFLASIRTLERNSFSSFFKTSRARTMLMDENTSIIHLLNILVGNRSYYERYLFDQQFSHQGWSGLVSALEGQPHTLLDKRPISLKELILFELLLEMDILDDQLGKNWKPLCREFQSQQAGLFVEVDHTELSEVLSCWQDAFEWSYYDQVLAGLALAKSNTEVAATRTFQAMFCIDERECSLRRHIESAVPACETFGTPGFFSVEFYFQPQDGSFYDKLCPQPVTPKYLIKEFNISSRRKHDLLYNKLSHTFLVGYLLNMAFGAWSAARLLLNLFRPTMSPAISNAFAHMDQGADLTIENTDTTQRENDLQIGFTVNEMAARVESLLRGIALLKDFAPIVYVIGHGSSSANNPHHGAHDCGACSGRPGSINARVFAFMANHQGVRDILQTKGIAIPATTQFVGGLHDTAADMMAFFDLHKLSPVNADKHKINESGFDNALDLDAKERSRRFASIDTAMSLKKVRTAIQKRSVSLFEPRPELGHGTNTLCIVGRRNLTKGLFLDRRAFLNSYDYRTDPEGILLTGIMKPLGPVCGGINLEYYFSRVDNYKLGAGTKLPHNVMGLFGVANSSDGDLRPGLPVQMIEVHDPVRLLIIVEHLPAVVLKTIQSVPEMYQWFINDWVHLVARNPETNEFSYFKDGAFTIYKPLTAKLETITDVMAMVESAKEMETNEIIDATKENLPVYLLN